MRPRRDLPPAALELARCQSGVLARAQLIDMGLSRHSVERLSRAWVRIARGIYLIGPDTGAVPWLSRVWAGVLLGGQGARACGLTAAALHGLAVPGEDLHGRTPRPGARGQDAAPIHVLVPGRHVGPHAGFVFAREASGSRSTSTGQDPPRTRIEDTALDLCAAGDAAAVVTWLMRACQRRLSTPDRLRRSAEGRRTMRHRGLVLEILTDVEQGATTPLEYRAVRDVFRPHGLPRVRLQFRPGSANRLVDGAIVAYLVLIELDGRLGHAEEGAFRDANRDNAHTLDGWITLRFGWFDITGDPCGMAGQIARLLTLRGWPGSLRRCPRCPSR